jgi:hypothetical protein
MRETPIHHACARRRRRPPGRLAAHLGADGVETGDAVPAALAKELRVALQTTGP